MTVHGLDIVILAAGRGSRLAELGDDRPKWLLEVGGRTIADRQLAALDLLPPSTVSSVTVVTGHAADAVRSLDLGRLPRTLHNPSYVTANNWYSVLLALESLPLDARLVVMNGDLCASPEWIAAFLEACQSTDDEGLLAVDFERRLTAESMKVAAASTGLLSRIGKQGVLDPVGEYVGLLYATGGVLAALRAELQGFRSEVGSANEWYEAAVGRSARIGTRWSLWPTPDSRWVEIDDLADLQQAEELVTSGV